MSQGTQEALVGDPARSLELVRGAMAEGLTTPRALLGDGSRDHPGRALARLERLAVEDRLVRDRHGVEEGLHDAIAAITLSLSTDPVTR